MAEERFWLNVNKNGTDGCWVWTGWKSIKGYGKHYYAGSQIHAHRVSWILANGKIPAGLVVRHKCRGKCVNPEHLELGSIAENNADKIRDGTLSCKLSSDLVRQIRERNTEAHSILAKEFDISRTQISDILSGKAWKWVI